MTISVVRYSLHCLGNCINEHPDFVLAFAFDHDADERFGAGFAHQYTAILYLVFPARIWQPSHRYAQRRFTCLKAHVMQYLRHGGKELLTLRMVLPDSPSLPVPEGLPLSRHPWWNNRSG